MKAQPLCFGSVEPHGTNDVCLTLYGTLPDGEVEVVMRSQFARGYASWIISTLADAGIVDSLRVSDSLGDLGRVLSRMGVDIHEAA